MKVIKGKFNDLSDALKKKIPSLSKGQSVLFQVLGSIANPDPSPDEVKKRPFLHPRRNIPMNDYIKDGDSWMKIVVADRWDKDEPVQERFFLPGLELGGLFNGKFELQGGNKKDEELYEYLMVCNYNIDSVLGEDRDDSIEPLFKIVNTKVDAAKVTSIVQDLQKSLQLALSMDEEAGRKLAASLNWSTFADWVELQAKVVDFASKEPQLFLKYYKDPAKDLKSQIKVAFDKQIIEFEPSSGEVKLDGNVLVVFGKKEQKNLLDSMVLWLNTATNGKEMLALIQDQLAKLS